MSVAAATKKSPAVQQAVPEKCALTAAQEKAWSDTRVALVWHCPAFAHIFYSMLDNANTKHVAMFTKDVPVAATDGINLLLNPDTFFNYNLNERIFIVCHEIMHCIWNHCGLMHQFMRRGKISYPDGTSLPYDAETMNVATDLIINDCLITSKVGLFNKDWLHDPSLGTAMDSAIDAYKKVYKQKHGKGGGGKGTGPKGVRFDDHLPPGTSQGKDPGTAAADRNDVEWGTQVAAGLNSARMQGKLPAGLERLLGEVLEPKVDWKDKITSLFARKVGSGSNDWRRPDRRLIVRDIYAPGRSGFGAGTVVVAVDTSGSIGPKELDMFFAEMAGILEDVKPKQMVVMWCDAKVHRVDELEEASDLVTLRSKGAPGGGGTSFVPVFDEIVNMGVEPDALVYLTDGYGTFPQAAPGFCTIWGNISAPGHVTYPFGDVVDIPKQAV
ncbi:MAG: VWA-like domain-containing protein [Ktedonobacteraceae bacterium]